MSRRALAVVAALVVLLSAAVVAAVRSGFVGGESAQQTPSPTVSETPTPTPQPAPTVLPPASARPNPGAPALADVVGPLLDADALGNRVAASVIDLSTGATLLADDADTALIPASTMKILTSAAVLEVLGPDHTFTTRVVKGAAPGEIVLVGGGDPTLTVDDDPELTAATRLATLADLTVAALTAAGTTAVVLGVDDGLFAGPAVNPDWRSSYVPAGVVGPVTALAVDGGRTSPDRSRRAADPALSAAATFAGLLAERGVDVRTDPARADARAGSVEVAAVRSAPLAQIVEHVLSVSDNDGAEVLARHVAWGSGRPASSAAAGRAMVEALERLGVDMSGTAILDGSGLARGNAVSPAVLVATLTAAASSEHPHLRAVLTGLPVAGFTGTLDDRFDSPAGDDGVGVVRAKTGTLDGVSSLAGTVVARDGSAYAFAVLADEVANMQAAQFALDEVAAALAGCGCAHPGTGTKAPASRSVAS